MNGDWPGHSATEYRPPAAPLRRYERCLLCPICKARTCPLFTAKNGRRFYACPAPSPKDHKFFVWADRLHLNPNNCEFIDVPYCGGCDAGLCRVRMEKFGENAGRILFMCRVKEGKGSCGYKAWKDEVDVSAMGHVDESTTSFEQALVDCMKADRLALMAFIDEDPATVDAAEENDQSDFIRAGPLNVIDYNDAGPVTIDLVEENMQRDDGLKDDSLTIDRPKLIQCVGGGATCRKREELQRKEETPDEFERRPKTDGLKIPESEPVVCGTYHPPVEPNDVAQGKSLVNSDVKMSTHISELETPNDMPYIDAKSSLKTWGVDVDVPTCNDPSPKERRGSALTPYVTKAFGVAAQQLQNDLITLLETMDAKEHQDMIREVEATFNALDHLKFNYEPFKENVDLFIRRAKSLAEIEQSMPNGDSYEDLEDICHEEKMKLNELEFTHDSLVSKVARKRKHLEVLKEEIYYTKDLLSRVEEDLSCGEKELKDMEDQKEKLLIEKEVLGAKYLHDSQKLEDRRISHELMEAEREAAKTGFDKARALLRG